MSGRGTFDQDADINRKVPVDADRYQNMPADPGGHPGRQRPARQGPGVDEKSTRTS